MWSAAFAFRERGADYVVRFHQRRDDLEKDMVAERFQNGALRVPHIVEIGDYTSHGYARGGYAISDRVHGRLIDDLNVVEMRASLPFLFQALDALRIADLSGTIGFGRWNRHGNASSSNWREYLVDQEVGELARQNLESAGATDDLLNAYDVGLAAIANVARDDVPRHAVHNDLLYRNVMLDDNGVVLLDWGASIFGDFLYDHALLSFWWPWYSSRWGQIDIDDEIARHFATTGLEIAHYAQRMRACQLDIGVTHIVFQATHADWESARWTAARTLSLASAPL